ncbi:MULTISPECIES: dynamin family protein [unclassified Clostridium]|uniref:dynamin family protein n=1 Tax=unclassified Clostridium TaxID=2614128 RepID=UPI00029745A5|nr:MULTISPECIES: dynamin family protein [unclassified Clostridium]EKQ57237.1 MAG: Fe2+ transport system protein B [Clostridium sp. Maddingley MBC34-26]
MTGFDLSVYSNKKDFLINNLNKLSEIASDLGIEDTAIYIQKSISELKDDKFKIVVVGEFSRGKSTFINALLGKRIFPAATKPTTTILNKISYSEIPSYKVVFKDNENSFRNITEDEFKKIVAPKEPIIDDEQSELDYENALREISKISYADIGYPTELCKGGIEIVDTPGTNDLDAAREEITYRFIPESDVAIMLLSANQALADSEMHFLKDRILKADIQKIYFVINFKDRIRDERDQLKIIDYVREHLEPVINNPKVFMVSSKGALTFRRSFNNEEVKGEIPTIESTGFVELEENMSEFLSNERGNIKLSKYIERGIRISSDLRKNSIAISLGTLDIGINELQQKIDKLKPEVDRVRYICNDSINDFKRILMNHGTEIQSEFRRGLERIAHAAVNAIDNYTGDLNKNDIARAVENTVAPLQTDLQDRISKHQQDLILDEINRLNRKLAYEWESINDSIYNELIAGSSQITLLENQKNNSSTYSKDDLKQLLANPLFLSAFVFRSILINHPIFAIGAFIAGSISSVFKKLNRGKELTKIKAEIDKDHRESIPKLINSFNSQWQESVTDIVEIIKEELDRKYDGIEQQLNSILGERFKEEVKVDEKRKVLHEQDKLLEAIINDLKELSTSLT